MKSWLIAASGSETFSFTGGAYLTLQDAAMLLGRYFCDVLSFSPNKEVDRGGRSQWLPVDALIPSTEEVAKLAVDRLELDRIRLD